MTFMSSTKSVTISRLKEALTPDFELGKLYFKPRGIPWWDTRYSNKECFNINTHGYLTGTVDKVKLLKHRVLWAMYHDYWPVEIDHLNRDPLDNRLENLREVSKLENQRNMTRSKNNTSGRTGVCYVKKDRLWIAYIGDGKGSRTLGYFKTYKEAVAIREQAEITFGYTVHGDR